MVSDDLLFDYSLPFDHLRFTCPRLTGAISGIPVRQHVSNYQQGVIYNFMPVSIGPAHNFVCENYLRDKEE
jgi:hypothetical protein